MNNLVQRVRNLISYARILHYREIEGFLTRREAIALYCFAKELSFNSTIVEIGTWKGKSAYCLAKGLSSGKIFVIDPFDATDEDGNDQLLQEMKGDSPLIDQFRSEMKKRGVLDKISILEGLSNQFVGQITQINLLFIDGDHTIKWCKHDFVKYSHYLINGGYLLLHDYNSSKKDLGPTWVVENLVIPSSKYKFIGLIDSLWIGQKIA